MAEVVLPAGAPKTVEGGNKWELRGAHRGCRRPSALPPAGAVPWRHRTSRILGWPLSMQVSASASLSPNFALGPFQPLPSAPTGALGPHTTGPLPAFSRELPPRSSEGRLCSRAPGHFACLWDSKATPQPPPSEEFLGYRGEMLRIRKTPSRIPRSNPES